MKTYFFSSDIHSYFEEWMFALNKKGFDMDNPDHIVGICGDLFDRGTMSVECFNFVKHLATNNRLIYIKGNHEELLFDCVSDLKHGWRLGRHHISNGTIKTISHFLNCSEYDVLCNVISFNEVSASMDPVLEFIEKTSVDYYELGDKVFVHGWVPTTRVSDDDPTMCVSADWRDGDWRSARWENGMEMAHFKILVPNKTVVCGHWHTSWGHSRYHNDGDEWDATTANFDTYYDDGIIALDACTAYTHMINVVVFDDSGKELTSVL